MIINEKLSWKGKIGYVIKKDSNQNPKNIYWIYTLLLVSNLIWGLITCQILCQMGAIIISIYRRGQRD